MMSFLTEKPTLKYRGFCDQIKKMGCGSRKKTELNKKAIIELATKGLKDMFVPGAGLFCHRVRNTPYGLIKDGISYRYTIISLLGLHKYESHGLHSPIDVENLLNTLIKRIEEIDNVGDLGLLLWLCALGDPDMINEIYLKLDVRNALNKYKDAQEGKTTEVSWFLAGLSHIALDMGHRTEELERLAKYCYGMLKENYGGKGVFGHMNRHNTLAGRVRGRIGCFADQIYPIYALVKFGQAYDNKEAIQIALNCAEKVCELQGPQGQWWWHYDAKTGKVIGRYPVYSVHQDGMAPMALFALNEVSGLNFETSIYKGLEWITGKNELGTDLIDESRNLIWRSFYQWKLGMYFEEVLSLAGINPNRDCRKNLKVLRECRPYHLGWLLYAFADK